MMSDLDRYLTDEAVEKAARALWDEPGWEQATHEQRQHHREAAERALTAVLPDIIQQAKAEALRDVAEQRCGWEIKPITQGGWNAGGVAASAGTHDRANQIEQGGQP